MSDDAASSGEQVPESGEDVRAYWTPERMAAARPLDMDRDPDPPPDGSVAPPDD